MAIAQDSRENLIAALLADPEMPWPVSPAAAREHVERVVDAIVAEGWRWRGHGLDVIAILGELRGFLATFQMIERKAVAKYADHVRIAPEGLWDELRCAVVDLATWLGDPATASHDDASEKEN